MNAIFYELYGKFIKALNNTKTILEDRELYDTFLRYTREIFGERYSDHQEVNEIIKLFTNYFEITEYSFFDKINLIASLNNILWNQNSNLNKNIDTSSTSTTLNNECSLFDDMQIDDTKKHDENIDIMSENNQFDDDFESDYENYIEDYDEDGFENSTLELIGVIFSLLENFIEKIDESIEDSIDIPSMELFESIKNFVFIDEDKCINDLIDKIKNIFKKHQYSFDTLSFESLPSKDNLIKDIEALIQCK
jgi:hypothetical protein